jgi:energy-coupling factor transporter ATP-binding protein EcfA2
MRLTRIQVTGLFGLFNHTIRLRLNDRITIIHGPNGFGKTAILQMTQALLTNQFSTFRRMPFHSFSVSFDDGSEIQVTKLVRKGAGGEKGNENKVLKYGFRPANSRPVLEHAVDLTTPPELLGFPIDFIHRHVEGLERIGPDVWLQTQTGRRLDLDDIIDIYGDFLPGSVRAARDVPDWLEVLPRSFDVRLIEAQRLINVSGRRRGTRPDMPFAFEPAVASYSRELAGRIQEVQAEYGMVSQRLDSTFPTRVLEKKLRHSASVEDLNQKLQELERRRQRIIDAGLLTKERNPPPFMDPKLTFDESTKGILSLYAEDVENKLGVFRDVTARIELFKELVNKRFSYKQIAVERESGFQFTASTTKVPLLPTDLSSGEQHELVLLYELLFKTKANALILIDEPELSLHVAWQVEFLKDLKRLIELSSFDAILATHSPQIINNRWDLTLELQGP